MIRVKIRLPDNMSIHFPETEFLCPYCGGFIRFFSVCPLTCNKCLRVLPDVKAMAQLKVARRHYYLRGLENDTDNEGLQGW
jgi:hypothetical protein